jgi:hypothetical protein
MPPGGPEARLLRAINDNPLFQTTRSPYAVLDRSLRIRAVNPAWLEATLREPGEALDRPLFDVFPDNPAARDVGAVAAVTASLLRVLRRGARDDVGLQRYDVPAPRGADGFVEKYWVGAHSPVRDPRGRLAGILVHIEDVTPLWPVRAEVDDAVPGDGLGTLVDRTRRCGQDDNAADTPGGRTGGNGPGFSGYGPAAPPGSHLPALPADPVPAVALVRELATEGEALRLRFGRHVAIEQAKGVLMATRGCGPEEAFALLRELSQTTNTKLRQVALSVVENAARGEPSGRCGG